MLEGYKWRRTQQINDNIANSWLTAKFIWTSPLPPLKDVLTGAERKEQTWQDMETIVKVLNSAYGGTVKKRGE